MKSLGFEEKYRGVARMLIGCPDRPGIVAAISRFLVDSGANIIQSDQYTQDPDGGMFFMRVEFFLEDVEGKLPELQHEFRPIAEQFNMEWRMTSASTPKKMVIFVSKEEHCLRELLWQWQEGDLYAEIPMVISNHNHSRDLVESLGIPYHHIPVTRETKGEAERRQQELMSENVDFIVLARYMQILSPYFVDTFQNKVINIHHSFLPAFIGGRPYEQAYTRGVKIIGATAHYVTEELDAGPIIEQDVIRVNHRSDAENLKKEGRHIERIVLARAVKWHLEDRILVHKNKTIVFT
ncbi:formyltetrahydrofolate deformylase [Aneurinibacillus sp. Ricciae_BoGa-3]|uniref:formyltetrahydrofolate deformylase n=1 Tax=Aneurinibacillus sp. Ricciae_BoGa-3 TaxID=3022697 RepID=UPI0023428758|nr:formyltetrahydrofolate deformylase [Aneurinibacillus sp. Ricciae_BoGa-3]WCK55825.1 formyltetrahydrofolate deformylase [Aneurinibacillus sp. Ricciae_BoGa-3]